MLFIQKLSPAPGAIATPPGEVTNGTFSRDSDIPTIRLFDDYYDANYIDETTAEFKIYEKLKNRLHPYQYNALTTRAYSGGPEIRVSNAWIKHIEILNFIKSVYPQLFAADIDHLDIAGAPGMFIISTRDYVSKYYPEIKYSWGGSSLEGGEALTDYFDLYKNNIKNYFPADLTKADDIEAMMSYFGRKFNYVSGDVGMPFSFDEIQETKHLDVDWGQAITAYKNCAIGGCITLKTYSLLSLESAYLMDILTECFESLYIVKPFASRFLNKELYVIGINKLKEFDIPLSRVSPKNYLPKTHTQLTSFEYMRFNDIIAQWKYGISNMDKLVAFEKKAIESMMPIMDITLDIRKLKIGIEKNHSITFGKRDDMDDYMINTTRILEIFTDGAAKGNSKTSPCGASMWCPQYKTGITRSLNGTNNQGELLGVYIALMYIYQFIGKHEIVRIYTDSKYVHDIINGKIKNVRENKELVYGLKRTYFFMRNYFKIFVMHTNSHRATTQLVGEECRIAINNKIADRLASDAAIVQSN